MAAHLCCRILLYVLILCVCSHAVCNADDIIEYFQALKRLCEEAERRWFTMDTNLLEHIHRKMQDHLSVLVGIISCCANRGELTNTVQMLYNSVLRIFEHYSSLLERQQRLNEGSVCPALMRTGRPGRPR